MKNVHLIGCGSPAGIGLTRCLKDHYKITGSDDSQWARLMMECAKGEMSEADLTIPLPDSTIITPYSRGFVRADRSFLPPMSQIQLCQDKAKCAALLGDLAPKTYWVRDTIGAGGKGAQMASEVLPGANYSVEFVYKDDVQLACFQKKRISYSVKYKTEGIENVGSSAVSVCTDFFMVTELAERALSMVADATNSPLNGFYGVDLKCTVDDIGKITEINAGRLLTASYSYYYLTGYNLPLVGVKAFLGEGILPLPDYPVGFGIIRQTDQLPKLFPPEVTKDWV